jgi:putative transposase
VALDFSRENKARFGDVHLSLGRAAAARREAYRELFKAHLEEEVLSEIRRATNGNYALGNARFQAQIAKALGDGWCPREGAEGVSGELNLG